MPPKIASVRFRTLLRFLPQSFLAAAALFGCLAIGTAQPAKNTPASAPNGHSRLTPSPAKQAIDVGCQGRVQPASKIRRIVAPADQGVPIIKRLLADEGAAVKSGDVLAILSAAEPARLMRDQAAAKVAAAKLALVSAEANAVLATAEIAPRRDDARAALAEANAALAATRAAASRKQVPDGTVRELEAAVEAAESAVTQLSTGRAVAVARADAAVQTSAAQRREAGNFGDGRIAEAALAEARAAREDAVREYTAREVSAAAEVSVAKARLAAAVARNVLPERTAAEVQAALGVLSAAEARTASLDALAAATRAVHAANVASARAEISAAETALALAEERLALTSVRAPISGTILRVFSREGEGMGNSGAVLEMADLSKMVVEAEVVVPDISRVKIGAAAEISLSGWNGQRLHGTVSRIGLRVAAGALADENPASFKDLRVVPVEIALDADASAALAGLSGAQVSVKIKAVSAAEKP